jgi:thymidylate kinase
MPCLKNNQYLCVEGTSGSGKTTLINGVSDTYQKFPDTYNYLSEPVTCLTWKKNEIIDNFNSYLNAELKFEKQLRQCKVNAIKDRNWVSLLLYQITLLRFCDEKLIRKCIDLLMARVMDFSLTIPDYFIFLVCPPEVTKIRRRLRMSSDWGDVPSWISIDKKDEFRQERFRLYNYFSKDYPKSNKFVLDYKQDKSIIQINEVESLKKRLIERNNILTFLHNFILQNI